MKANVPEKIYLYPYSTDGIYEVETKPLEGTNEYIKIETFMKKTKEAFCKATCNGHPPRSTCTSLGTCREYDNFVNYMKGE